jgi:predicted permease
MIEYSHLMGGLISSEFPYLIMIVMGVFLTRQKIFHKEGAVSFAKLMIEIFLPVYLFINIARSTSVLLIQDNYLMIISVLLQMFIGGLISFIYLKITKMNIKYRWSWLIINCFVDHKQVHKLLINSFCYHLTTKTPLEKSYCSDVLTNNFTHVFFQDVFIWYIAFNLVRNDRKIFYNIKKFSETNKLDENGKENSAFLKNVKEGKIEEAKQLFEEYSKDRENVSMELYQRIEGLLKEEENKVKPLYYQIIYVMMRPPLISIFVGFIVGFIPSVQAWIFTTTNAIYVFFN